MKVEPKIHIAIIIPGGIGTGKNNVGVPSLEQIIKLLSTDFSITVFQLFKTNKTYEAKGFEIVTVTSWNPFIKMIKLLLAFRRAHLQYGFKIVHGFWVRPCGFFAVTIGKLWRIKSLVSLQGGDVVYLPKIRYGQLRNFFHKKIAWWTLRNADLVTALTRYLVDTLSASGFTRSDIQIVPFGTDPQVFKFRERSFSHPLKMLNVGNLHPVKDQNTLLHAFKLITERISCELTLIGEGSTKSMLNKTIVKLGLTGKVSIQHPVAYDQLPLYYEKADIMLHTSLTEGQAVVVAEAMSCGILVCGTRVGLLYDLPECFVTVELGEYERLAEEVIKIVNDPHQIEQKRKSAFEWARTYTVAWTASEFKRFYQS